MKKATKKIRVVFEKVPGSDIWWICYFDANGRKRREKVGRKGAAIELYRKRKTEIMEGKKLPNPARLVPQRKEKNARIRFLSTEEERVLRQIVQTKYWSHLPELDLALNTGLRLGEQYGLSWECVDFQRRTLTIPVTKNGECRHVPLNDAAIAALEAASKLSSDQPWVFLNRYAERLVSPREWFDPAAKEAGLQGFTWHCLRHTFASQLVMAGVVLRTVQELMGHKTIQMTVRYAHLAPKHQLAAVQRLCDTGTGQKVPSDTRTDTSAP